jgi:hypothetical protein
MNGIFSYNYRRPGQQHRTRPIKRLPVSPFPAVEARPASLQYKAESKPVEGLTAPRAYPIPIVYAVYQTLVAGKQAKE